MSGKSRNRPASADRGQEGWRTAVLHFAKGRSLGDCAADGRDNILLLRLLAALMVVFGHCVLAGPGTRVYAMLRELVPQIQTHVVGLMMFFTISGFLITLSFERHPELLRFLRARALRLWPALIVCVLAWAFVLGPMLTALPLREYAAWHRPDNPYAYAWDNASLFRVRMLLPGLFEHNRIPLVVNSSLWTIPVEATMYLWVAGAGTLRLLRFPWVTSFAIAAVFGVLVLWPMSAGQFHYMSDLKLTVQGFFGAGAIACLLRRHIPVSTGLMLAIAIACTLASHTRHATPMAWLAVGYFVLWFAYVPRLPSIPHDWDLSYGIYLWAWPLQQTVVEVGGVDDPLVLFVIVVPVLCAIAIASWLCIERSALRLKDFRWRRERLAAQPP